MQSRLMSMVESVANIVIGFTIALVAQLLVFPLFDINITHQENFEISMIFTVISLCRSYLLRRVFNAMHK